MVLSRSPTWLQNTSTTIKRTAESAPSVTAKTGLFAQVGPGTTGSAGRESRVTGLAELAAGSSGRESRATGLAGLAGRIRRFLGIGNGRIGHGSTQLIPAARCRRNANSGIYHGFTIFR